MESVHLGYDADSCEETSLRQLVPPDSVDENDLFGDRQVNPRIGDKFQVEIPPIITGSEYIQLLMNPTDSGYIFHVSHSFLMGLAIPIMWLRNELNNADESVKYTCKKNRSNTGKRSSEPNFSELNGREELKTKNCEVKVAGRTNLDQFSKCTSCSPVPGFLRDPWKDAEKDIFLLGLYIFGKNFFQIKRFIETKEMGDILSFYYGEFYRSSAYRRWTDCRKPRSRKCVYGRKIFSGWRQQELVSRLLPHIPEESQNSLLEQVSKSFAEGRTSLESYVFYLQATVGICALVESVGIGKGKEDLTSLTIEPVKTNPMFSVCPTMPSGKACSSLTSTDIIKFLTGDFRLSKARCNDIFWEAVWPRLLARGWRSEQPRNQGYVSSKDYLVFLMPGVKKFSRRKLVKGDHYFDSVSDILKKVASEPKLLELAEEPRVSRCNEEDQWVLEELSDQDNPSNHQPHCYLKPLTSNCKLERMKFMVVDSSLVHGGKSSKARELRYLPVHFNDTYKLSCLLRTNEGFELDAANMPLKVEKNISTVKHSKDTFYDGGPKNMKFMVVDTSLVAQGKSWKVTTLRYCPVESKISSDMSYLSRVDEGNSFNNSLDEPESNMADTKLSSVPDDVDGAVSNKKALNSDSGNNVDIHPDQRANNSEDRKPSDRVIKLHFSRRAKSDNTDSLAPLIKRRRLTACAKAESCIIGYFQAGHESKEVGPCSALDLPDAGYNDISQVGTSIEKISQLSCSAEGSPEEEIDQSMISGNCFGMKKSHGRNEKHQTLSSIDPNVSKIPSNSDNGEELMMEVEGSQGMNSDGSLVPKRKLDLEAVNSSVEVISAAQQPNMNPRRQSTRNRPLTAKALEALACGFLNVNKKQKGKDFHTREITFSNPSRKARSKLKPSSKRGTDGTVFADLKLEKESKKTPIVSKGIVGQPIDQNEEKALNG